MDICARFVLSGKKLDSLRRRRSWLSFLALWFQVTEYCDEMERWRGAWPGGRGGVLVIDEGGNSNPM